MAAGSGVAYAEGKQTKGRMLAAIQLASKNDHYLRLASGFRPCQDGFVPSQQVVRL